MSDRTASDSSPSRAGAARTKRTGAETKSAGAEQSLEATIEDVIFRSEDGRFAVVRGPENRNTTTPATDSVTVVGDLGRVCVGETLRFRGRWGTHPTYGRRFMARTFTPVMPTNREGMTRYLGSGLVPGVGGALAKRLVERFGVRTLDVITQQSVRLREVEGIGPRRAEAIAEAVRARMSEAETLAFLRGLDIGTSLARRILRFYGDRTARIVRDDPYLVAEQVRGVGFLTADRIGRAVGIADDDPRRAAGAILHLLGRAADQGHSFAERDALRSTVAELNVPDSSFQIALEALIDRNTLALEDGAVFTRQLYGAETYLGERLRQLATRGRAPDGSENALKRLEQSELSEEQRQAVRVSLEHGLLVLTGGPGTGKTTTVRELVRVNEALGRRVLLAAPTGRAAKRLSEATGRPALTIHRALEWSPQARGFKRGEDNPFEAELVLVDEASMLDLQLAESLVRAVGPACALVLVGDADQLPPIGAGHVFREVIKSQTVKTVRLGRVFRQAQQSAIVQGAHSVLHGERPVGSTRGERGTGDLFLIPATEPDDVIRKTIQSLKRMQQTYGLNPLRDVQVLAPTRRGPLGTEQLNQVLQREFNAHATHPARQGSESQPPDTPRLPFFVGDKVMQLRNDYDRDVFNGDVGEVRQVQGGTTFVQVDGREVQYSPEELDALALAYACTVHKVQGSEFPAAVIVLHGSHYVLLSRALLYTAMTRAKRLVVIVGDERALRRAIKNRDSNLTNSRLAERIAGLRTTRVTSPKDPGQGPMNAAL